MSVKLGYQDAMICGTYGRFDFHIRHIIDIIGRKNEIQKISTLSVLILAQQTLFITDAFMDIDPTMEQIVETTLAAAKQIELFGIKPKVALLSHSNFGSSKAPSAVKMGKAVKILRERAPDLEVDGEMHADAALNESLRNGMIRDCALSGAANLLIFPTLDSANSALGLVKSIERGLLVGPILLGAGLPAHVVTPGVSARGILNMTAIAVKDAQKVEKENLPQLPL